MRLIGLMVCRNDAWVLRTSIAIALKWVDVLVVLDHASVDDTAEILGSFHSEYGNRVVWGHESNPEWNEAQYRQRLLETGRQLGGTHFAIIDSDELLTANLLPHIKEMIAKLRPGVAGFLPWLHCWRSLDQYRCDSSDFGSACCQSHFCDYPKLQYFAEGGYEFHERLPQGCIRSLVEADGGILHLQHANWDRLLWKQLWYQMQEVIRWGKIRANYSGTVNEDACKLKPVPPEWIKGYECLMSYIDLKSEPWQMNACRRLFKQFGPKPFITNKVNFFGLEKELT